MICVLVIKGVMRTILLRFNFTMHEMGSHDILQKYEDRTNRKKKETKIANLLQQKILTKTVKTIRLKNRLKLT